MTTLNFGKKDDYSIKEEKCRFQELGFNKCNKGMYSKTLKIIMWGINQPSQRRRKKIYKYRNSKKYKYKERTKSKTSWLLVIIVMNAKLVKRQFEIFQSEK